MASTKQTPLRDNIAGENTTTRPHLVDDNDWTVAENVRSIDTLTQQVPRKYRATRLNYFHITSPFPKNPHTVKALANITTGRRDQGILVALTDKHAFQVQKMTPMDISNSVPLGESYPLGLYYNENPATFNFDPKTYMRWATVLYANQLWFTNELNPLHCTDGTRVKKYASKIPSAKYIEAFFDHIVVANDYFDGELSPYRVRWSHLYDPSSWCPKQGNEADFYDIQEWVKTDSLLQGITGMSVLRDSLIVYTASCIVRFQYVGLPKVMQVTPIIMGKGNYLSYGLVKNNDIHYFFDGNEQSFFSFDGQQISEVGQKIRGYFAANISRNYNLAQQTWGYARPENNEICWVFVSTASTGPFDRQIVFNYETQEWHHTVAEDLHSFGGIVRPVRNIATLNLDLYGTSFDGLVGTLDNMADYTSDGSDILGRVWGTKYGMILAEEHVGVTPLNSLIYIAPPLLESKDFTYGSIQEVKEIDTTTIHANYTKASGVEVSISARNFIDDPVVYKVVGIWTPALAERRLSFPRIAGKIFRYKFRVLDTPAVGGDTIVNSSAYAVQHTTNQNFGSGFQGDPEQTNPGVCGPDVLEGTSGFYQPIPCPAGQHYDYVRNMCVPEGTPSLPPPDPNPTSSVLNCTHDAWVVKQFTPLQTTDFIVKLAPAVDDITQAKLYFLLIGAGGGGGGQVSPGSAGTNCVDAIAVNTYAASYTMNCSQFLENLGSLIELHAYNFLGMFSYPDFGSVDPTGLWDTVLTKIAGTHHSYNLSGTSAPPAFTTYMIAEGLQGVYKIPVDVVMSNTLSEQDDPDYPCHFTIEVRALLFVPGLGYVQTPIAKSKSTVPVRISNTPFVPYYSPSSARPYSILFDPLVPRTTMNFQDSADDESAQPFYPDGAETIVDGGGATNATIAVAGGGAGAIVPIQVRLTKNTSYGIRVRVGSCPEEFYNPAGMLTNGSNGRLTSLQIVNPTDNTLIFAGTFIARGGTGGTSPSTNGAGGVVLGGDKPTFSGIAYPVPHQNGANATPAFGGAPWRVFPDATFTNILVGAHFIEKGRPIGGGGVGPGHWNSALTVHEQPQGAGGVPPFDVTNHTRGADGAVFMFICAKDLSPI